MGLITYGKITKRHGLSGEVKVLSFSGTFESLKNISKLIIRIPPDNDTKSLNIIRFRIQKNTAIVKLEGIDTPEAADQLKNSIILIEESELPDPGENEYYWLQLIGLKVRTRNRESIGTVKDLLSNPGYEILVVQGNDKEIMIPFVEKFVKTIDLENSEIIIQPIEGLLE